MASRHGLVALSGLMVACSAAPSVPTGDGSLEPVAWLAGTWCSEDGETEETWAPPRGGTMIGTNRTVRGGRTVHHEFLLLLRVHDAIVYRAHPAGQAPNDFTLVEAEGDALTFADPEHDYPQRITYARRGDQLTVTISGDASGDAKRASWRWVRGAPLQCPR